VTLAAAQASKQHCGECRHDVAFATGAAVMNALTQRKRYG